MCLKFNILLHRTAGVSTVRTNKSINAVEENCGCHLRGKNANHEEWLWGKV